MIQFECPHCRESLKVPVARADTEAVCSGCHKQVRIPPIVSRSNGGEDMPSAPPVIQDSETAGPSAATEAPAVVDDSIEPSVDDTEVRNESSDTQGHDGSKEASPRETNEGLIDSGGGRVEVPNTHFDDLKERVKQARQANSHADKIHRHTRDHALVGVSRATIYIFVALICCVALTSFWAGTMIDPAEESLLDSQGPGVG